MQLLKWFKGAKAVTPPGPWSGPVSMYTGSTSTSNGAGIIIGYVNNMRYTEAANVGWLQTRLFRDIRVPASPQTVRVLGIISQSSSLIVLAWEVVSGTPPTAAMPQFTNKLRIDGGTTYDFTSASAAGTGAPTVSRYLSATLGWAAGQNHTIEFI